MDREDSYRMQERQAEAPYGLGHALVYGRRASAACAAQARLAEREPVQYTLTPRAEALFSEASPQPRTPRAPGLFRKLANGVGDAIDEFLYGASNAEAAAHHAEADRLQAQINQAHGEPVRQEAVARITRELAAVRRAVGRSVYEGIHDNFEHDPQVQYAQRRYNDACYAATPQELQAAIEADGPAMRLSLPAADS